MSNANQVKPAIGQLGAVTSARCLPSVVELWNALAREQRISALTRLLTRYPGMREPVENAVAEDLSFRKTTIKGWTLAKLAAFAIKVPMSRGFLGYCFRSHLSQQHEQLWSLFFERIGSPVPADDIEDLEDDEWEKFTPAVAGVLDRLSLQYPAAEVALLATGLESLAHPWRTAIENWYARLEIPAEETAAEPAGVVESLSVPEPVAPATDMVGFTALDRLLIRAVVDSASGIEGSLDVDSLDDAVNELMELNSSRHQTFFHLGFRDAVLHKGISERLPAENRERRSNYFAGVITSFAREGRWAEINDVYDSELAVRELCSSAEKPAHGAAYLVFQALCRASRTPEAARFLKPLAVSSSELLRSHVLTQSMDLIRSGEVAIARALLDHLWQHAQSDSTVLETAYGRELSRRYALCLRQLDEAQQARDIFTSLTCGKDPAVAAIAHCDLGLLAAGFVRLGDLVIPDDAERAVGFRSQLEQGRSHFEKARQIMRESGYPPRAHAEFPLGVLSLLAGMDHDAVTALDIACAHFRSDPEVYSRDGTLFLAECYLGLAISRCLIESRLGEASSLIQRSTANGVKVPRFMIRSMLEGLALQNVDLAERASAAILGSDHSDILDELLAAGLGLNVPGIRSALWERANAPHRTWNDRAADYRQLLPALLAHGELPKAAQILEQLEEWAANGFESRAFLELLDTPVVQPVWEPWRISEARLTIFEAEGRYADAAALIETEISRRLASREERDLEEAVLLLATLDSYGPDGSEVSRRLGPIVAAREAELEPEPSVTPDSLRVRILVVGGNENQEKMDADIQKELDEAGVPASVSFLHTGWSSNWREYVEDFERRTRTADGVVLLYLMRTNLGRTLRRGLDLPWRGCGRKGKHAIIAKIKQIVPVAQMRARRTQALDATSRVNRS